MTEMEFIHLDLTHFGCLCARVLLAISMEPTL